MIDRSMNRRSVLQRLPKLVGYAAAWRRRGRYKQPRERDERVREAPTMQTTTGGRGRRMSGRMLGWKGESDAVLEQMVCVRIWQLRIVGHLRLGSSEWLRGSARLSLVRPSGQHSLQCSIRACDNQRWRGEAGCEWRRAAVEAA